MANSPLLPSRKKRKLHNPAPSFRVDSHPSLPSVGIEFPSNTATFCVEFPAPPEVSFPTGPVAKCNSRNVLIREFEERHVAAASFPPSLDDSTTRKAIQRFQIYIAKVCACCGSFTLSTFTYYLNKTDSLFRKCVDLGVLAEAKLVIYVN